MADVLKDLAVKDFDYLLSNKQSAIGLARLPDITASAHSKKDDQQTGVILAIACMIVQIVDSILLLVTLIIQAAFLNYFFLRRDGASRWWMGWFFADGLVMAGSLVSLYLSYNHLQVKIPISFHIPFLMRMRVSPHGVLPYGFVFWLPYSLLLVAKITVMENMKILEDLPHDGWFTTVTFQLFVGLSCPIFLFLLKTHRDPKVHITHSVVEYLADLGSKTSLEILDSIDMMGHMFEKDLPSPLTHAILVLSCVSLVLPFVALMKLGMDDSDERKKPVSIYVLYSTVRVALVDVPYLTIRIYIAYLNEDELSIFALKNVLNIMAETRYLVPAYIRAWRLSSQEMYGKDKPGHHTLHG